MTSETMTVRRLYADAIHAYDTWCQAVDRRDEDIIEAETYANGIRLGYPMDPSVLRPPAPEGAVEAAREAYCHAYDDYHAACDAHDLTADGLPDPAREPTKPLAWLDPVNDRIVTEMTNRAIYVNYPTLGPPPAEFSVEEFYVWAKACQILLANVDDSPDDGPINIDECLAAGAIKAVSVRVGGTDQRLYMVQPGFYHRALGFRHPGRGSSGSRPDER